MAKRNVKKRDFSKAKEKALKILKISAKVIIAIIGIAALLAFVDVPFLHSKINDVVAKFVWYPSCVLFVVSAIATVFKNPKTSSKYPIFDFLGNLGLVPIVVIFSSAFLINYYDTAYIWWWAVFFLILLYIPVFTFGMRNFLKKAKEYTEDQLKASLKICWKYVCFYWLIDLFYMAVFNYWIANEQSKTIWLTLQFIFGGLAMIYIFYNLTRAFLSNTKKHWWGLLQDFLWGVAITIYLIFLIPSEPLQTIVLSITAAVYGGLLTLVGVAWTIKDNSEKIKQERKLSIKPYLDVRYKCFADITELPSIDILTIELGKIVVIQPTISNAINDLFILRSRTSGIEERLAPAVYALELARFTSSHMMVYTEIENCGAGNAIDVKLKFNGNEITSFCITTSTPKQILFVLKDELLGEEKEEYTKINLSFEYTDVASFGRYRQDESFIFGRNTSDELYVSQMQEDLLTPPVEI